MSKLKIKKICHTNLWWEFVQKVWPRPEFQIKLLEKTFKVV